MNQLESDYAKLEQEYRGLVDGALQLQGSDALNASVAQITEKNQQLSSVLDKMLSVLASVKQEGSNLNEYKDELVRRLQKIQTDYNNLKNNTDRLETLRRIREYEYSKTHTSLNWYMLGFFVVCAVLLICLFVFGRQPIREAAYAIPTAPAMIAPLM